MAKMAIVSAVQVKPDSLSYAPVLKPGEYCITTTQSEDDEGKPKGDPYITVHCRTPDGAVFAANPKRSVEVDDFSSRRGKKDVFEITFNADKEPTINKMPYVTHRNGEHSTWDGMLINNTWRY